MKYLTGNPLGSTDVRDLLDNAIGLDDALNDLVNSTWTDRFGRVRKTLKGYDSEFEADQAARAAAFQAFLDASGWSSLGAYAAGINIISHTQTVDYEGQPYQLKPSVPASVDAPYVTTGNWAVEGSNFKLVGDNSLRQDLGEPTGAKMSGWIRSPLTSAINTAGQMLDAQGRSIWEFEDLVTNKPDPANSNTWDWTPAFTKACEGQISLFPAGEQCTVVVPPGIYKVSKFVCGRRVQMYFAGGSLAPFDRTAVEPYLVMCIGHSRIYNITVDMDYATKYDTVMWFRGRHIDVFGPEIWRAKNCFTFGDPAWANDPALGVLGDSEVNIIGGDTVWCVQHHKCYGQNTIVTFTGNHKGYIFQKSLEESDPRYAEWMAIEPIYGENWGGLIYYTGCMLATFTGQVAMLRSHVQPVPTDNPAYKNAYGKYYLDNCHIEAGRFFECVDGAVGFKANDTSTRMFTMRGCNGFLTGNPGWMVATGESLQSVYIDDSNNFYGQQVLERLIYAPAAPVHFGLKAFTNIKDADPFAAMYMTKAFGYPGFNPVRKTNTSQAFSPTFTTIINTTIVAADIRTDLQTAWTSMANGRFIPPVAMRNIEVQVALAFTGGQLTDSTTFRAVVDGAQQDIIAVSGVLPTATLRVRRLKAGQQLEIQVSQNQSRTADGSASNRIIFTGDA